MSRLLARFKGLFSNRTLVGVDKVGNRYFTATEEIDGVMKEKRWVVFKGEEQEPTSVPVEWICWLNGQRKRAPTPEELAELEARREQVRQNVALLKKEEEKRKATKAAGGKTGTTALGKVAGPNLRSFIQQLPIEGEKAEEASDASTGFRSSKDIKPKNELPYQVSQKQKELSEPTGSGGSFKPGTWQPPT